MTSQHEKFTPRNICRSPDGCAGFDTPCCARGALFHAAGRCNDGKSADALPLFRAAVRFPPCIATLAADPGRVQQRAALDGIALAYSVDQESIPDWCLCE